jgi:hypothetical protein
LEITGFGTLVEAFHWIPLSGRGAFAQPAAPAGLRMCGLVKRCVGVPAILLWRKTKLEYSDSGRLGSC